MTMNRWQRAIVVLVVAFGAVLGSAVQTAAAQSITTASRLANGVVGSGYSQTLSVSGGAAPYRWYVIAGSLPAGLSLGQTTGVISGTPTTAVAGTFSVAVTDAASSNGYANFGLTVTAAAAASAAPSGPLSISTGTQLPSAATSVAYSTTLVANGGSKPYRWVVIGGALPSGVSLNQSTGVISGTAMTAVAASFAVAVTDAASTSAYANLKLTVSGASAPPPSPSVAISTGAQLPAGTVNTGYSTTLAATGGTTPYRWLVTAGSLPAGLSLNLTSGVISGTPTAAVAGSFTIAVTDAASKSASATFSLTVNGAAASSGPLSISTGTQLPNGTTSVDYSTTLTATGGTQPYRWVVIAGTLPAGLTLNTTTGLVSGTPTTAVAGSFSVAVTDATSTSAYANHKLNVTGASGPPPPTASLAISSGTQLPAGTVNTAYSTTLTATGGTTPYRWQVTSGAMPAGLSLNQTTGVISGTPTSAVAGSFTVAVTDAVSTSVYSNLTLPISAESTGWTLVWSDEFDGTTIDGSKWLNPTNDNSCSGVVKSTFMGDDAYLDGNGHLVLRAQSRASGGCGANHVTGGQVSTKGRFAQAYGKFEFRAQMPAGGGSGSWPALWMYPIGNTWPPEIDVLEMQADPNLAVMTYHWGTEANHQQSFEWLTIPGLSSGYHTFAVEWDPGAITWFIDDKPVRSSFLGSNVTSTPMGIIMGMQIGDWNGAAISPTFPKYLNVDYVRVYKRQ